MSLIEILNKLKWHEKYDFNKVIIWYINRPDGVNCIRGEQIKKIGKKFLETEGKYIPYHRIIKIEYEGEIIYKKS